MIEYSGVGKGNIKSSTHISVWDLDANEWRTIIVDRVQSFEIERVCLHDAVKNNGPWGHELVVDAFNCNFAAIKNADNIRSFLDDLVISIDMIAFGEPILHHFGSADKKGYTAVQLIETSCIS